MDNLMRALDRAVIVEMTSTACDQLIRDHLRGDCEPGCYICADSDICPSCGLDSRGH